MALEAQDNPFPYVTLVETADPSTPAAGTKRLWVDTDNALKIIDEAAVVTAVGGGGAVATDAIFDAKGDLAVGTGADTADNLTVGANDTILMADSGQTTGLKWVASQTPSTQAFGDAAAEGTADTYARGDHKHAMPADPGGFAQPTFVFASQFQASSTSCAVTTNAFTTGDKLLAFVYSTARGCNSITQTNVTWTQRYTGNGNSEFFEVWTGVVSGTAGTTATFAFTGSNTQYCEVINVTNAASAFTAASSVTTGTASGTALVSVSTSQGLTVGNYYVVGGVAAAPASSYQITTHPFQPLAYSGGQGAGGFFRAVQKGMGYTAITSSAVNRFIAIVGIT